MGIETASPECEKTNNNFGKVINMFHASFARPALFAAALLSVSATAIAAQPDRDGATATLSAYKSAIEHLDVSGADALFAPDAIVVESGKVEGNFQTYAAHHLGPELKEFKSFTFRDYKADVRVEGPFAYATETYTYQIVLKSGEVAERNGVATSVLKWNGTAWQILSTHSSSRKPTPPKK